MLITLEKALELLNLPECTHIIVQAYSPSIGVYPVCGGNISHVVARCGKSFIMRSDIRDGKLYVVIC